MHTGSCSDLDKQATLKIRDNPSAVHPVATLPRQVDPNYRMKSNDPMYDSIRRQRASMGNPIVADTDTLMRKNNGRFVPLKDGDDSHVPSPAPNEEYSSINKTLSGAQIAHILSDKSKGECSKRNTQIMPGSQILFVYIW